jgi:hypothetical protein
MSERPICVQENRQSISYENSQIGRAILDGDADDGDRGSCTGPPPLGGPVTFPALDKLSRHPRIISLNLSHIVAFSRVIE